jgi:hypothetical protein
VGRLREGYNLRHEIVHELKDAPYKNNCERLLGQWSECYENSVVRILFRRRPEVKAFYDQEYERGIERDRKRKILAANSERILKLLEADIKLPQRYNLTMADLGLEDVTEEIDGTLRVMEKRKRFDTNSREYDEFNFQRKESSKED